MSTSTAAARRKHGAKAGAAPGRDYEARMAFLEAQMEQLMAERYGRETDRERFAELSARAQAIGGGLERTFGFDEAGRIVAAETQRAQVNYRRPYWLTRNQHEPVIPATSYSLPRQFGKLELAVARDEQTYENCVRTVAYDAEEPVVKLMDDLAELERRLKTLAQKAGGSLELKSYNGKIYAYYYRYKRLKTATVFSSLLKHAPYHSSGKHRYTFWLPIDYALLRQLLEADAKVYAALPEEMRRPGYPADG